MKVTKLDTFVAIANALDVSADTLLIDVVDNPDIIFKLYIDGKEITIVIFKCVYDTVLFMAGLYFYGKWNADLSSYIV